MAQSNTQFFPSPVDNGKQVSGGGPKTLRVDYDFSAGVQSYTTDVQLIKAQGKLDFIQSIFIDNSTGANNQPVVIQVSGTNQSISVPNNFQGVFPLLVTDRTSFLVSSTGNGKVSMFFCNFEQAPFMWQGVPIPINVGGTLAVADAILDATVLANKVQVLMTEAPDTIVDNSGTVGTVNAVAAAANAARQEFFIQNLSLTQIIGVNIGAAASIGTPGTITLFPGASLRQPGTGAINVIADAAATPFTLKQW